MARTRRHFVPTFLCFISLFIIIISYSQNANAQISDDLFNLSLEELLQIEVVTASRRAQRINEAPGIITVVTADEIQKYGANNLVDVLERLPGLAPLTGYVFQNNAVSIRGDLPNQNDTHFLILINGRPYKAGFSGTFNGILLNSFPVNSIKQLEFIRGPGSVLYGSNAYSGVLNIITKTQQDNHQIDVTAGSWGSQKATYSGASEFDKGSLYYNLSTFKEDGFPATFIDETGTGGSTEFSEDNQSFNLSGHYDDFKLDMYYANTDQTHLGSTPRWDDGILERDTLFIGLGHNYNIKKDWALSSSLSYTSGTQDYATPPPLPPNTRVFNGYANELTLDLFIDGKLSDDIQWIIGTTATQLQGEVAGTGPSLPEYKDHWSSIYTQIDTMLTGSTSVYIGGQWQKTENTDGTFVPRIGLINQIDFNWSVKLMHASAFRSPYPAETSVSSPPILVGNPNLRSETVDTTDLQFLYKDKSLNFNIGMYHSKQDDLIVRAPGSPGTFINQNKLEITGLELDTQWRINKQLQAQAAVSTQKNEDGNGTEDQTLAPDYLLKIGIIYAPVTGFNLSVFDYYTDEFKSTRLINPGSIEYNPEAGGEHMVSLNATWHLPSFFTQPNLSNIQLGLYITNLLDNEFYIPEYSRGTTNTLPAATERAIFMNLSYQFK